MTRWFLLVLLATLQVAGPGFAGTAFPGDSGPGRIAGCHSMATASAHAAGVEAAAVSQPRCHGCGDLAGGGGCEGDMPCTSCAACGCASGITSLPTDVASPDFVSATPPATPRATRLQGIRPPPAHRPPI